MLRNYYSSLTRGYGSCPQASIVILPRELARNLLERLRSLSTERLISDVQDREGAEFRKVEADDS